MSKLDLDEDGKEPQTTLEDGEVWDMLKELVEEEVNHSSNTNSNSSSLSSGLLVRCVELLISRGEVQRGMGLFVSCGRYRQAIDLCLSQKITITPQIASILTPSSNKKKSHSSSSPSSYQGTKTSDDPQKAREEEEDRIEVIRLLAKVLKKQGAYDLASTKYTESGDRLKALKCLMQGAHTTKVIKYAQACKNREMYVLSSNYLQQVFFHAAVQEEDDDEGDGERESKREKENEEVKQYIVMFCKRAKAYEQLSSFYQHLAQIEMDEYRDYEKALQALKEGLSFLSKASSPSNPASSLQNRIQAVEMFVEAREAASKRDLGAMVRVCEELLDEQGGCGDENIRVGDVFALLIEQFFARGDLTKALHYIHQMQAKAIPLEPYLEESVVREVSSSLGVAIDYGESGEGKEESRVLDEIDDEEDFYGKQKEDEDEEMYGRGYK